MSTETSSRSETLRQPSVLAWLRLVRVFQKVDRASAEFLRRWDLSVAQFDVLAQVSTAEGMKQQELANRLLVTKGNVSQLLDRLEQRGLIRRCQDGRAARLRLTEQGRALTAEVVPAQEEFIAQRFACLSDDERHQLHTLLHKLDRAQE
jgi:DNA-binding MarR family transcriptional regulator